MRCLFLHNNFPGQFRHLAIALALRPGWEVRAIGAASARTLPGVILSRYAVDAQSPIEVHPFARRFDTDCRRAEQVLYELTLMRQQGWAPDVIVVHPGWGEGLPLREVFPDAKIITYLEFYYKTAGSDIGFDPEFARVGLDGLVRVQAKNASTLLSLVQADQALSPTKWQRSQFPAEFYSKIEVVHDGVDVADVRQGAARPFQSSEGVTLTAGAEVITFVARNLEPYRGYHVFMRALPIIQKQHPNAVVLIVGGDGVSYGAAAPTGGSWKQFFLDEVGPYLDLSRIVFTGPLNRSSYLSVLGCSAVHVYLTYPFVLSWSLVEAMAAGCLVIGSDTPPVQEVIEHGRNGLLTPFLDPDALAKAVVEVLTRPSDYAYLRQAAARTATEHFDLATVCLPRQVALIERTMRGRSPPGLA